MKKSKIILILSLALCLLVSLTACGSEEPVDSEDDLDEVVYAEGFDGWWVVPEDDEGLSMFTVMQVFPDEGVWYYYDQFGNPSDELYCTVEDGELTLDMEFTTGTYVLDGDSLVLTENGEVQFVRSGEPEFLSVPGYDGTWYLNGDPNALKYYVIEGNTATLFESYDGEEYTPAEPIEWTPGNLEALMATGDRVENVTTIDMGFMQPTLYIDNTGLIGYTDDMFDYIFYAHESMVGSPELEIARKKCELMSTYYRAEPDADGNFLMMRFLPYGFDIMTYGSEGSSIETEPFNGTWSGVWGVDPDGTLLLQYFDGTEEQTMVQDGTLEAVGSFFVAD